MNKGKATTCIEGAVEFWFTTIRPIKLILDLVSLKAIAFPPTKQVKAVSLLKFVEDHRQNGPAVSSLLLFLEVLEGSCFSLKMVDLQQAGVQSPVNTTVTSTSYGSSIMSSVQHIPKQDVIKLTESTYLLWKHQVTLIIDGYGLLAYISGDSPATSQFVTSESGKLEENPMYPVHRQQDKLLASWLLIMVSMEVFPHLTGLTSSRTIWNAVLRLFGVRSSAKISSLRHSLHSQRKVGLTVSDYLAKIKTICDLLNAAGCVVPEQEQVSVIIAGLSMEFESIIAIASRDVVSLHSLTEMLLDCEARQKAFLSDGITANMVVQPKEEKGTRFQAATETYAIEKQFYSGGQQASQQGGYRGRGRGRFNNSNRPQCPLCGKFGHIVKRCYRRFDRDFTGVGSEHQSTEQWKKPAEQTVPVNEHAYSHTLQSHVFYHYPSSFMHGMPYALTRQGLPYSSSQVMNTFPGDCGTHPAKTEEQESFVHTAPTAFVSTVPSMAAAHSAPNHSNALWYPDTGATHHVSNDLVPFNSGVAYKGNNTLLMGNGEGIKIHDAQTQNILLRGKLTREGLYQLLPRLGHSCEKTVKDVMKMCNVSSSENKLNNVCSACLQGKAHKLPFSEVQFGKKIKALQSDGGGEYQALKSWFFTNGVQHRISCPSTSEQNGKAERKHRHIVEMGLVMLAQAALPIKFWSHAFTMAVYIINRLPSEIISGKTPFEVLYQKTRDYSGMKEFGCDCFPFLRPFNQHKLDFRSRQCVFLGPNISHHGYKCLDSDGRVFVSRRVRFDEQVFKFNKSQLVCKCHEQEVITTGQLPIVYNKRGATPLGNHHNVHGVGATSSSAHGDNLGTTSIGAMRDIAHEHGATPLELITVHHGENDGAQSPSNSALGVVPTHVETSRRGHAPNIINGGCVGNAHGVQENYEAILNNDNAPITNNGAHEFQGGYRVAHGVQGDSGAANSRGNSHGVQSNHSGSASMNNGACSRGIQEGVWRGVQSRGVQERGAHYVGATPNDISNIESGGRCNSAHGNKATPNVGSGGGSHGNIGATSAWVQEENDDAANLNIQSGGGSHGNIGATNINNENSLNGYYHGIQEESRDDGNYGSCCSDSAHGFQEENQVDNNCDGSSRGVQEENGATKTCVEIQRNVESEVPQAVSNVHPMMTRTKHGIWKPKVYNVASSDREPANITEAFMSSLWKEAAQAEYKARLVAKGFLQKPGIDFDEVFSPVVKPATIRVIISLVLSREWKLRQIDVNNAFLNGMLTEEVYMTQPPGYEQGNGELVCKLHKAIYGLKQAPRAWFERLKVYLESEGFCLAKSDASLYVRKTSDSLVYLLVYVDDIIVTGDKEVVVQSVIDMLNAQFSLKDLGPLSFFLGVEVSYEGCDVVLSQQKYIQDLLQKHGFGEVKSLPTPMVSNIKLSANEGTPLEDAARYRSIVGALQYIVITRPDVAFAVNRVCQFMQAPLDVHFMEVKQILRYLQGTIDFGLRFTPSSRMALTGFVDANWGSDVDDRRSTSGFCIYFCGNLVSWSSRKQHVVARSTVEAEYRSVACAAAEMVWLRSLLGELHVVSHGKAMLWCDNTSAVAVFANPVLHSKFKHVELDLFFYLCFSNTDNGCWWCNLGAYQFEPEEGCKGNVSNVIVGKELIETRGIVVFLLWGDMGRIVRGPNVELTGIREDKITGSQEQELRTPSVDWVVAVCHPNNGAMLEFKASRFTEPYRKSVSIVANRIKAGGESAIRESLRIFQR
ncbi:Detected protein of confused Function [Hibiscus syriacus]|uniref:Detected protein of confused Function n=1 Tax=Hibiscus syriacus TaxID=106335 RepID=A0A6A2WII0_HIBSY|nr:Detected protein of confused Function [Hibiscus syriacus]